MEISGAGKEITIFSDEHEIKDSDRDDLFLQGIELLRNNIIICGQSMSGKSSLLQNMLTKKYVHKIKPEHIYIFSKTASYDMAYRPLLKWLCEHASS